MTDFQAFTAGSTEAQVRLALAYLFAQSTAGSATTGVLNGLAVTQTGTASAAVVVAAGSGVTGASQLVRDSSNNLDILTANPMGATARNDLVVFDPATKTVRAVIGTPNVSPTDPATPTGAIPLARVRNAASATTIPTASIDDLRVFTTLFGVPPPPPFAQAAGQQAGFSAGSHAAGAATTSAVTFPAGRFSQAPRVVAVLSDGPGGSAYLVARAISVTSTGFTVALYNTGTTTATYSGLNVDWHATQMTSAASSG